MIVPAEHIEGLILSVWAQPGARRAGIVGERAGALKVAVAVPAEDGRANRALIEILREQLRLKRSQVELLSGATSREKKFLIRGVTRAELTARLAALA